MPAALPNVEGDVFRLTEELLETGKRASRESERRRIILPIHRTQEALVQRMLNFLQPGTYITAHMHPREHAIESIYVINGCLGFALFNEEGDVTETHRLEKGDFIDFEPKLWHGMVALKPDSVMLEIKRGPYNDEDKIFAPWAPEEGSPEAPAAMEKLEKAFQA